MKNKLKAIISEEFNNYLNEGYVMEHDNLKFRQVISNEASFHDYQGFSDDYDIEITQSEIVVNWSVKFWLNNSGIENFIVEVTGVEGNYLLEQYNRQTDKKEQETPKDINEVKIPWKFVIGDATINSGGSLYISDLIFNFANGECQIVF